MRLATDKTLLQETASKIDIQLSERKKDWLKAATATEAVAGELGRRGGARCSERQMRPFISSRAGTDADDGLTASSVDEDMSRINCLGQPGRLRSTEADFFIRSLAQEAGLGINTALRTSRRPLTPARSTSSTPTRSSGRIDPVFGAGGGAR